MRTEMLMGALCAAFSALAIACGGDDSGNGVKEGSGGNGAGGPGSGTSTSTSTSGGGNGCGVFPADNWWNTDISSAPVAANSDQTIGFINSNGGDGPLHADFDSCCGDGIPYVYVDSSVAKVNVSFNYADESDPGPYPIPASPPIENGGDHHILMVHTEECKLYELFAATNNNGNWHAGSGAIFDLTSNDLRPDCWTSADAAGLPIFPGLVRDEEVNSGAINHALRFTVDVSQQAWMKPARHQASDETSSFAPPMGARFRLKTSQKVTNILAAAGPQPKVVLETLQKYGMFLADNGSNWYVSGSPSDSWDDDGFHDAFDQITGDDFEMVETGETLEKPNVCN